MRMNLYAVHTCVHTPTTPLKAADRNEGLFSILSASHIFLSSPPPPLSTVAKIIKSDADQTQAETACCRGQGGIYSSSHNITSVCHTAVCVLVFILQSTKRWLGKVSVPQLGCAHAEDVVSPVHISFLSYAFKAILLKSAVQIQCNYLYTQKSQYEICCFLFIFL